MIEKIRDTHTRWVIMIVSAAIVTALGTFAMLDRSHVADTAQAGFTTSTANERRIEVLEERTDVRLKNIEDDVREIKAMLRERE